MAKPKPKYDPNAAWVATRKLAASKTMDAIHARLMAKAASRKLAALAPYY
jgi:hypothetical protein